MRRLPHIIFIFLLFIGVSNTSKISASRISPSPDDTLLRLVPDDPIVSMLDSMISLKYFQVANRSLSSKIVNRYGFSSDSIPSYNDSTYANRLAILNAKSPISLDYNETVRGYINLYAFRKREQVMRMLGLAEYYFPLFEEKLDKYNMPLELKYLAIVESALNANAKSRVGATGLWQFMYGTGKMYNLKIDSYIDERSDPFKSTEAACQYMKFLHKLFGDWQLVLAAYNAGPGTVNKAIRRSGGKRNYWQLRPYLPVETRGYVPAFIAVNYIMNYSEEHNFYAVRPAFYKHEVDTLSISQAVGFDQIAAVLDIPISHLQFLNPVYKNNYIPAYSGNKNILILPSNKIAAYMNNDSLIYAYNRPVDSNTIAEQKDSGQKKSELQKKIHVVRKGQHLGGIANQYRCQVSDLKEWNNLRSNKLMYGQKLVVYLPQKDEIAKSKEEEKAVVVNKNEIEKPKAVTEEKKDIPKYIYHTVQPGDTLWDIANKYKGVSIEDIKRLNNIRNAKSLKIGTKLKVSVAV